MVSPSQFPGVSVSSKNMKTGQIEALRLSASEQGRLEAGARAQAEEYLKTKPRVIAGLETGVKPSVQMRDEAWKMGEQTVTKGGNSRTFQVFLLPLEDGLLHVLAAKGNTGLAVDCGPMADKDLLKGVMPHSDFFGGPF